MRYAVSTLRWMQVGGTTNICLGSTCAVSARSVRPDGRVSEWSDEVFHTVGGLATP